MRCSKAQRWISRRLDGELDDIHGVALTAHLARCPTCSAYAEKLAALDLGLLQVPEPTPSFTARLVQQLAGASRPRWLVLTRPVLFRPIAAGLGIAATLVGFAVGSRLQSTSDAAVSPRADSVETVAESTINPLAEDSVESVLIAMLADARE